MQVIDFKLKASKKILFLIFLLHVLALIALLWSPLSFILFSLGFSLLFFHFLFSTQVLSLAPGKKIQALSAHIFLITHHNGQIEEVILNENSILSPQFLILSFQGKKSIKWLIMADNLEKSDFHRLKRLIRMGD